MKRLCGGASAVAALACAGVAIAVPVNIGFTRVTSNNSVNPESQFKCVLDEAAGGAVSFRFTNTVGIASSITEVYFQNGPLLNVAGVTQNGCTFGIGSASPGNLPGGNGLPQPFSATSAFSADVIGATSNGINTSGDWLEMRCNLIAGLTFNDVVAAINNGTLRIGLHVRGIGPGQGSDSFVDGAAVPLPPAVWTGLTGLATLGIVTFVRRRRMA